MKKIFAIILSLLLLMLCACTANDSDVSNEESLAKSESVSENNTESSDITSDSSSDESDSVSKTADSRVLNEIKVEHGVYTFYDDGIGEYFTEFDTVKNKNNGNLTLNLKDGRSIELVYGEIVYDESDGIHKTEINGLAFWVEDITDGEGRMLQILECIERPQRSIFVHYYPELDCGDMTIVFNYEANGSEYTFKYADGQTSIKTILFDEETEEYYFG